MKTLMAFLVATLLALSTTGCDDSGHGGKADPGDELDPDTVVVRVDWLPASIPNNPESSRTLELSANGVLTSEGDDDPVTEPMDAEKWEEFVAELPDRLDDIDEGTDCVGAGGTVLTVEGAGEHDTTVRAMVCGGDTSDAADDIERLVADFT